MKISYEGWEPPHVSHSTITGWADCGMSEAMVEFLTRGRVVVSDDGCYEWGRSLSHGYGRTWDRERKSTVQAHRLSWELANERAIPEGLLILHSCDNKRCVNPAHLRPGTYLENFLEAVERLDARPWKYQARKTHCPSGHAYTDDSVYYRGDGSRMCKECARIQNAKRKEGRRAGLV